MLPILEAAAPILRAQHSLITRPQTLQIASETDLRRLLRNGVWEKVDRCLYGPTGVPMHWHRRLMAAVLLAPPGSLISHRAAGGQLAVGGLVEPKPEITIPRGGKLRRPWLITHESLDLELADHVIIQGIPTTGPRRLAVDLGGVVSFERFKHTIRELRFEHGIDSPQLLHTYIRHKVQGRTGGGALRDWLDRYFDVEGVSESGLELVVLDALLDAGLPAPVRQHWVEANGRRYRIDLAYLAERVAIEVDGRQHEEPDVAASDAVRTKDLRRAGWIVLRIRSAHMATDLPVVIRQLRSTLDLAAVSVSQ